MNTLEFNNAVTPAICREVLEVFWREQVQVEKTRHGVALTLPLMYPDGWQVSVQILPLIPGWAQLTDQGKTLGALLEAGMSVAASRTASLLEEKVRTFELATDGAVLTKNVRLPLQGIDIQLFGEALVSIAHLIFRHEPAKMLENPADKTVQRLFARRQISPRRNAELEGRLVQTRVDYLVEARRPLAVQVVGRRENLLDYMEKWAFRWDDLRRKNESLLAAMVYNPDNQEWDDSSLRIGREVCDAFCRYDEIQPLSTALEKAGA